MPAKPATTPFITATTDVFEWNQAARPTHTAPDAQAATWEAITAETASLPEASALPPLNPNLGWGARSQQ
jgi:hypothetical protein